MDALSRLDALPEDSARAAFRRCCGASRWVDLVMATRPHETRERLLRAAARAFEAMDREDWLEAFSHHPKIGDRAGLAARFASTRGWAQGEQAGAAQADDAVLDALADVNRQYEERFGYIFIVCATGKSAAEMLALAEVRLRNDPEAELRVAAAEQTKITALRLEKLLEEMAG